MSKVSKFEHLTLNEIEFAHGRISPHVHETPVMTCTKLDQMSELKLFFKCESLQKTGSFKARGACNAILKAKQSAKVIEVSVFTV